MPEDTDVGMWFGWRGQRRGGDWCSNLRFCTGEAILGQRATWVNEANFVLSVYMLIPILKYNVDLSWILPFGLGRSMDAWSLLRESTYFADKMTRDSSRYSCIVMFVFNTV